MTMLNKTLPGTVVFFLSFFLIASSLNAALLSNEKFDAAVSQNQNRYDKFHIGDELPDLPLRTKTQQFKETVGINRDTVISKYIKNNFNKHEAFNEYWNAAKGNYKYSLIGKHVELQSSRDFNRFHAKKGHFLEPTSWYGGKHDATDLIESTIDPITGKKIIKNRFQYKFYTKGNVLDRFKKDLQKLKYKDLPFVVSHRLYNEIKKSTDPIFNIPFNNGRILKSIHSDNYYERHAKRDAEKEFYRICNNYDQKIRNAKSGLKLGNTPSSAKIAGKAPKTIASTSKGFKAIQRGANITGKAVEALAFVDIGISAYSFLNDLSIANQQNELDPDLFIGRSAITSSAHIGFDVTALYFVPATPDVLTGLAIAGGLIVTEIIVENIIDYIFNSIQAYREWLRQIEEERVRNVSRLIQKHTVYKQHECIAIILRQMALEL